MTRRQSRVSLVLLALLAPPAGVSCNSEAAKPSDAAPAPTPDARPEAGPDHAAEVGRESGSDAVAAVDAADVPTAADAALAEVFLPTPDAGREVGRESGGTPRDVGAQADAADARPDTGAGGDLALDAGQPPYKGLPQPMCVWNQAYQENYAADSVLDVLGGASHCYVLVDPFTDDDVRDAISPLKQAGNLVSCYISVGTCEEWRDDFAAMKPYCVGKQWGEWPGEYFVDRTDAALVDLMKARVDKMEAWGCNMVEFDNMDFAFDAAYRSQYGITATAAQGEAYNQTLCAYVHAKGMGCMAKSSAQGASDFDGLTVESAPGNLDWWEASEMAGMLSAGKIGIVVHYDETDCAAARASYQAKYGGKLSFICEDRTLKKYRHFP